MIPIIDVFSGPGGLGEGFSAYGKRYGQKRFFKIGLSVEKDANAHRTLKLRSFFRQFSEQDVPDEYYAVLREELQPEQLREFHKDQFDAAEQEAWRAELGSEGDFNARLDNRIRKVLGTNDKWVLIGGPPCQAYSVIGRARTNRENDEKNYLYLEYLRIIARHHPAVFVMENVKGILSSSVSGIQIFRQILSDLESPVYGSFKGPKYKIFSLVKRIEDGEDHNSLKPADFVVKSELYGVPQARHRVILLGVREDLAVRTPGLLIPHEGIVPIEAVLKGLPRLRSGLSQESDGAIIWRSLLRANATSTWIESVRNEIDSSLADKISSELARIRCPVEDRGAEFIPAYSQVNSFSVRDDLRWWYDDPRIRGVINHSTRSHMREDIFRYAYASLFASAKRRSPKLNDFPTALQPEHRNASSGHFSDRFRVQVYGRPATTITCHISKDGHYFIHPDYTQSRSLTVREAARIQTFPDNYFFCGGRTPQYVQVGNAVPPLLAYQIAGIVLGVLGDSA